MSYSAQQAMLANESLLKEWSKDLQYVIDGEEEGAVVYKGPATGLSHHDYRLHASSIEVGDFLTVKPDPQNKYDANATGLFYGNKQIGWVPKAMNSVCADATRNGCELEAQIIRHKEFNGDFTNILFVEVTATLKESEYDRTDNAINQYYGDRAAPSPPPWQKHPMAQTHFGHPSEAQKKAWSADLQRKMLDNVAPIQPIKSQEQDTMATKVNAVIEKNITLGTSAAFLEAGRIASNQLSSVASKKLPIMVRAYADTAVGRLLLANIAVMAAEHFRPEDNRLRKLVEAMTISSYQEVLQTFDIEQMIEDLVSNKTIAKALKAVDVEST